MVFGHIKVDRKILSWKWYKDSNMLHVFLHLLLNANHKEGKFNGIDLKRGQLAIGRKQLSDDTGLTEREVRTCLEKLKNTNEIEVKPTNKFTIVTIVNYNVYQASKEKKSSDQQNDQQETEKNANKTTNKISLESIENIDSSEFIQHKNDQQNDQQETDKNANKTTTNNNNKEYNTLNTSIIVKQNEEKKIENYATEIKSIRSNLQEQSFLAERLSEGYAQANRS